MDAWVGLVGMAIVAAATIIATQLQARAERKEKQKDRDERQRDRDEQYRQMLYPKVLEAYQGTFYHVEQLLNALVFGLGSTEKMRPLYQEARGFYDSNCLYLDKRSRHEVIQALLLVIICLNDPNETNIKNASNQLEEAHKAIVNGIELTHIEELQTGQPKGKP